MKTKYMIIGYGWRADFYYRIAKLSPEHFEITAAVLRTKERALEVCKKENIFATSDLEEGLKTCPDFVVLCVPKAYTKDYLIKLMKINVPVLCETPPGENLEEMNELWNTYKNLNGKIQIAEQYFLQPYYASVLSVIKQGYIGDVSSVMLSAIHGYHGMSIFRKLLGIQFENCTISASSFVSDVTVTNGRNGFNTTGDIQPSKRILGTLNFDNQKLGIVDFQNAQYFSAIRRRRWNIQGTLGEIDNNSVTFMNKEHFAVEQPLQRIDVGINNISEWSHKGIQFMDKLIYTNPYYPTRMNDDEIAIATCLTKMKKYIATGKAFYSLAEALQDNYLAVKFEEALSTGKEIKTTLQDWSFS